MARNELRLRLAAQLSRVQKAMMTATNAEMLMLESLRKDIEKQLCELQVPAYPQPKAA